MLATIRKALSSWVVLTLLTVLLVAFIITGVQDPFGGGPGAGTLAKVGKKEVTTADFQEQYDRLFRAEQQNQPTLTREAFAKAGADREVLSLLVTTTAISAYGDKAGVHAGVENVTKQIRSIPAFQIAGQFDVTKYQEVLAQNRITRDKFQKAVGEEMARDLFIKTVSMAPVVPDSLAKAYVSLLEEKRTASIAVVPSQKFASAVGNPDEKALAGFYKATLAAYTVPELRSFRYVTLDQSIIEPTINVSDADIAKYYADHQDEYAGAEKRKLQQLVVADEAAARTVIDRVKKGEKFEAVAKEVAGYAPEDLALGERTKAELTKDAGAAAAQAAFMAPQGQLSAPVKSELGWFLFRTESISQVAGRSLTAVKKEIGDQLRKDRSLDKLYDVSKKLEDELAGGKTLDEIAQKLQLPLKTVPSIAPTGFDDNGQPIALEPEMRPIIAAAFSQKQGDEPSVQERSKDSFFAVEVLKVTPPTPLPLEKVKAQVVANWKVAEQAKRAAAVAESLVKQSIAGTPLAEAALKAGLPPAGRVSLRRIDALQQQGRLPPPVVLMFKLNEGQAKLLPAPNNQGYFVVKLDKVEPASGAANEQLQQATKREIAKQAGTELAAAFVRALQEGVGVKYNQKLIDQLHTQLVTPTQP